VVDFFPKPNGKLITVGEALKNVTPGKIYGSSNCLNLWKHMKNGQNASTLSMEIKKKYGYNSLMFSLIRLDPKKPAPTIIKISAGAAGHLHWKEPRRLTIPELQRLCSFPDDWKMNGKEVEKQNRLGNAIMPKLMQAIAENIKKEILKYD